MKTLLILFSAMMLLSAGNQQYLDKAGVEKDKRLVELFKETKSRFSIKRPYAIHLEYAVETLKLGFNEDSTFIMIADFLPYSGRWERKGRSRLVMHFDSTTNLIRHITPFGTLFAGDHEVKIVDENTLKFVNSDESRRFVLTRDM